MSFVREEAYPAQGVAGQAYTGVLVTFTIRGQSPRLEAFLVNASNQVVAVEGVTSGNARESLYSILSRDMK